MGFLAPAFLALAVLAGVPLLVHLLRRRVGRTVEFPAVRYLARMEQEHSRELKLRHRLLLFLRVLAVIALALAAALPLARIAGLGHAPVALALLIDNSMSSGAIRDGQSVIEGIRADAHALIASLSEGDRAWIVTADGRVVGGPTATLQQAIAELHSLGGRGNMPVATRRAIALARSGSPRAAVVAIASDGQRNTYDVPGDSSVAAGDIPIVALVRAHGPLRNRAVLAVRAEPARWTPSGTVTFAIAAPDSAAWRVTLDGRTVARGTVGPSTIAAPTQITQRLASTSSGWVRGSVEVDPDELRGDDARWFAVRVASPPPIAVRNEAGPFVAAALATLVDETRLARGIEGTTGVAVVSGADAANLHGPALLLAPSDPLRVGEANRTLTRLGIPWRFGAIARDVVLARNVAASNDGANVKLEGTSVRTRYSLMRATTTAGVAFASDTLATAGGTPWIVAGPNYVIIASPMLPDATDLPLRAAFIPWMLDALSRRLGDDGQIVQAHPGDHLVGINGVTGLERPDGTIVPLIDERIAVPSDAGVYLLRRQGARIGALVVNPETEESDVGQAQQTVSDPRASATFLSRVTGRAVSEANDGGIWRARVLEQTSGRSLLPALLLLALLAVMLEAWFSRVAVIASAR